MESEQKRQKQKELAMQQEWPGACLRTQKKPRVTGWPNQVTQWVSNSARWKPQALPTILGNHQPLWGMASLGYEGENRPKSCQDCEE